jgi:hypothetical protein
MILAVGLNHTFTYATMYLSMTLSNLAWYLIHAIEEILSLVFHEYISIINYHLIYLVVFYDE